MRKSLVRICANSRTTVGTGFVVDADGTFLTCAHVVREVFQGGPGISCNSKGQEQQFSKADVEYFGNDVAVVRIKQSGVVALPLGQYRPITEFSSLGFLRVGQPDDQPFPVAGRINGDLGKILIEASDEQFPIANVAVLVEGYIDFGLSGAPLYDTHNGVVVGVIVAKLTTAPTAATGFAVRFDDRARARSPGLAELLDKNAETVPAGGAFLNAPAINLLAKQATAVALKKLEDQQLFLPEQFVARNQASGRFAKFERSAKKIFPITGDSGTGKTTFLADIARSYTNALYLRAADFQGDEVGLCDAIHRAVKAVLPSSVMCPQDPLIFKSALLRRREPLVVLLDGINEFPDALAKRVGKWLDNVVAEIAGATLKLVVTSRPEFWESVDDLLPPEMVQREESENDQAEKSNGNSRRKPAFTLRDFDEAEVNAAIASYRLQADPQDLALFRHPLMCRLAAFNAANKQRIDRLDLLDEFVQRKCQRIVRDFGLGLNVPTIRYYANEVAKNLLIRSQPAIARDSLQLIVHDPVVSDAMVREHLFVMVGDGMRFAFDEVSEFLQSASVEFNDDSHPLSVEKLRDRNDTMATGAVGYALARLERTGGDQPTLKRVVEQFIEFRKTDDARHFLRLRRLLSHVCNLRPVLTALQDLFQTSASDYSFQLEDLLPRLESLAMEDRIDLAMQLVPFIEDSYGAEPSHWHRLEYEFTSASHQYHELPATLRDWLMADPAAATRQLVKHFTDSTPFRRSGSAVVGEYAARVVYTHRDYLSIDTLVELALLDVPVAQRLIRELAAIIPEKMIQAVLALAAMNTLEAELALAAIVFNLRREGNLKLGKDRLLTPLHRYLNHPDARVRDTILVSLGSIENDNQDIFDQLFRLFKRGGAISAYELTPFFPTHLTEILTGLWDKLVALEKIQSADDMQALGYFVGTPEQQRQIFHWLGKVITRFPKSALDVARTVESRLNRGIHPGDDALVLDLCRGIIASQRESAIHCLIYASFGKTLRELEPLFAQIRDLLATPPILEETAVQIIDNCIRDGRALPRFKDLRTATGPQNFARRLLLGVERTEDRGKTVLNWLRTGQVTSDDAAMQEFLRLVADGLSPDDAASRVLKNWDALRATGPN